MSGPCENYLFAHLHPSAANMVHSRSKAPSQGVMLGFFKKCEGKLVTCCQFAGDKEIILECDLTFINSQLSVTPGDGTQVCWQLSHAALQ